MVRVEGTFLRPGSQMVSTALRAVAELKYPSDLCNIRASREVPTALSAVADLDHHNHVFRIGRLRRAADRFNRVHALPA